jgi:hypothetical protein
VAGGGDIIVTDLAGISDVKRWGVWAVLQARAEIGRTKQPASPPAPGGPRIVLTGGDLLWRYQDPAPVAVGAARTTLIACAGE